MKALIINCSPVCTGATAEIAKLVSEQLSAKYSVKSICLRCDGAIYILYGAIDEAEEQDG